MTQVFVASDHHFSHENIVNKFKREDGKPLRPFTDIHHMNEEIIYRHNSVVGENDLVYMLGDCTVNSKHLHFVSRLNGRKRLVKGNHDNLKPGSGYYELFEEVYGVKELKGMILSHIPLHESCVDRFGVNIHGHTHSGYINSPKYLCVSLEHTNYFPITLEEVRKRIEMNQKHFEKTGFVIDFSDPDRY